MYGIRDSVLVEEAAGGRVVCFYAGAPNRRIVVLMFLIRRETMLRKSVILVWVVLMLGLGGSMFAAEEINNRWQAYGGGEWSDGGNWELGVPTLGQDARMDQAGIGPTISAGTNAVCDTLRGPSFEGGECTMTIDGGTLSIEYDWRIGDDLNSGPGIVNMNGGEVHMLAKNMPGDKDPGIVKLGGEGEGIFNMYDGIVIVGPGEPPFGEDTGRMKIPHEGGTGTLNMYGGRFYAPRVTLGDIDDYGKCGQAYINMYGGILVCAELLDAGTCASSSTGEWLIDIYDGIIQVMGYGGADIVTQVTIEDYVASGNIISRGGAGQVEVDLVDNVVTISSSLGGCACAGDINGDDQRDLDDLQAVAGILLAAGSPFVVLDPPECVDMNGDGQADLDDLQGLAQVLLVVGGPFVSQCE